MRKIADENAMHQSIPLHVKDSGMHVHYPTCRNTRAALERYEEAQKEYENFGRFSDFLRAPIFPSTRLATIDPATGNNRENPHQILDTAAKTQLLDNRKVPVTANPWNSLFHDGFIIAKKTSTILTKRGGFFDETLLRAALTLARKIGDRRVEVNILTNLANLCEHVLNLPEKAQLYRNALKGHVAWLAQQKQGPNSQSEKLEGVRKV